MVSGSNFGIFDGIPAQVRQLNRQVPRENLLAISAILQGTHTVIDHGEQCYSQQGLGC